MGENMIYEAFFPGNLAAIIVCFSDNNIRTAAEVKFCIKKHNGSLSDCMFLFNKIGIIETKDAIESILKINDIDDFEELEDKNIIYCDYKKLDQIYEQLEVVLLKDIIYIPKQTIEEYNEEIISDLEELNDVIDVFTNV